MANPFDPAAVSDETAAFNRGLETMLAAIPKPYQVPVALTRKARDEGRGIFPEAGPRPGSDWQEIPGAAGRAARVRVSLPPGAPRGTYLHIHGGGWTFNAPQHYDQHNQRIAKAATCRVISIEYRLAPENPWPTQAEDCLAAALWALDAFDGPVVIGGESAGGHLSAVILLRLRAAGRLARIAGAVLNYGVFDMRGTPSVRNWGERYLVLSTPVIDWFGANLMAGHPPEDPDLSPLLADLAGFPPSLLQVGTADPLLDDTLFMAARLKAEKISAELAIYPGGVHAFDQFDLAIARAANARQDAFIAACLVGA